MGEPPKTAWVIDYALFERIYYLLVAGYDVFGNVGHQLNSRLYMDFMRMEGEFNFLVLLPQQQRRPTARHWYRGATDEAKEYVYGQLRPARRRKRRALPQQRCAGASCTACCASGWRRCWTRASIWTRWPTPRCAADCRRWPSCAVRACRGCPR